MQNDIEILQFFPKSICSIMLPEMVCDFWQEEISNIKFYKDVGDDNPHWKSAINTIEDYPEMKELFLTVVKDCLKELGYDQKIIMTTSWLTAVKPKANPNSISHHHANSWYSCVYYFQNGCSDIVFTNYNQREIEVTPTKSTIHNSVECSISPQKHQFIMFPSYMFHKISENTSNETRHSLVFNIMPTGIVGEGDSMFVYR
jgi:uncharacterized protein (TIGR02466 family)